MTDKVENPEEKETSVTEEVEAEASHLSEDDDDMIVAMKEAEAEIAAQEGETGEDQPDKPEPAKAENKPETESSAGDETKMVPLARLNQVLSEQARLKESLTYMQGVVETQKQMISAGKAAQPETAGQKGGEGQQETKAAETHESIIDAAEKAIIEAAQQYEEGEISLVEFETKRIESNRLINAQLEQRSQQLVDQAKKAAVDVVSHNNTEAARADHAMALAEKHPYVAAIDSLPEAQSELVWNQIREEAALHLRQNGLDPVKNDAQMMATMAALTDKYGPFHVGEISTGQNQKTEGHSEIAKQRAAKLALSEQQPPRANGTTEDKRTELTEEDISKMDQDQIADMLETAPSLVLRAAGIK